MKKEIVILEDLKAISLRAAGIFRDLALQSASEGRAFNVALPGGSTPRELYKVLAAEPFKSSIDWGKVSVFFTDERCVPKDHEMSNYRMVNDLLLRHVGAKAYRINGDLPPAEAAKLYESVINRQMGRNAAFDLVILGLGADGHTASIFPDCPATLGRCHTVIDTFDERSNIARVTLTLSAINRARRVVFFVSGRGKASIVKEVLKEGSSDYPAGLVLPRTGELTWLLDKEAAEGL